MPPETAAAITGMNDTYIHQVYAEFDKDEKRAYAEKIGARFTVNGSDGSLLRPQPTITFALLTDNQEVITAYMKMITKKTQS